MGTLSLFSMLGFSIQPVDMAENRRNDQKPATKQFILTVEIIDSDVLKFPEAEETKTRQRKTQTDVAFVMTFRVNCGKQKQNQRILRFYVFNAVSLNDISHYYQL